MCSVSFKNAPFFRFLYHIGNLVFILDIDAHSFLQLITFHCNIGPFYLFGLLHHRPSNYLSRIK